MPRAPAAPSRTVRPQLKLLLETLRPNPAYITSRTLDLLAANPGVMALYAGIGEWPAALVGELMLKSPDFAKLWERYEVTHRTAALNKTFHHPQVGTVTLGFQGMQPAGTPGQRLGIYLAEPGTPDYDAMILLDLTALRHTEQPAAQQRRAAAGIAFLVVMMRFRYRLPVRKACGRRRSLRVPGLRRG